MPNVTVYVMTVWQNLPSKSTALEATNLNHIEQGIKNVTDFINTLNTTAGVYLSGAPFTQELLNKLNGIEAQANKYVLPTASNATLGGVKVDAETITIDNNGVIHAAAASTSLESLTDVDLYDLQDGQILKYDATTQKWINTSEAEVRTQLSLLEDVDIDDETLEDGQVLKYNATSEKWENGESGDVLGYDETLEVLGDVPDEVNAGYKRELLWGDDPLNAVSRPSNVVLAHSIGKYDDIRFVCGFEGTGVGSIIIELFDLDARILNEYGERGCIIGVNPHAGQWLRVFKVTDTSLNISYDATQFGIYQIYGIKY